jgi:hypothetical protein
MSVRLLILMAAVVTSCARPPMRVGLPAPNPNGCYVMMYERPEFQGVGDVLNGPGRWATLVGLSRTNEENWRNRIRSLRTGDAADVTVYTTRDFTGESGRFQPGTDHARLNTTLSGRIESLQLACRQTK